MTKEFTSQEKTLFKAEYNFAVNVLKCSELEAREKAMNKIIEVRLLSKKLRKLGISR